MELWSRDFIIYSFTAIYLFFRYWQNIKNLF